MSGETSTTEKRKRDHLAPFRDQGVSAREQSTWLSCVRLIHCALPELGLDQVQLRTRFAGRDFAAPLFITGMTGGTAEAGQINRDLARVAQDLGIGFGLGSGRAMIEDADLAPSYAVREAAPDVFLAFNLGGVQLASIPTPRILAAMDKLGADALCIHLNPAQELVQPEGDRDFSGVLERLTALVAELPRPVIVKETGAGISRPVGQALRRAGVRFVDVAGCGGTSWVGVELSRDGRDADPQELPLWDWGIPTAAAVAGLADSGLELIASGGIRTGLDAARALALGARLAGLAAPVLQAYFSGGRDGAARLLRQVIEGLSRCMLLCGCCDIEALWAAPRVIHGPLRDWFTQTGLALPDGSGA